MKLSELTVEHARLHTKAEPCDLDQFYLDTAKRYVLDYTAVPTEEADKDPTFALAALVLFAEFTDNKQLTMDRDQVNRTLQSLLDMHCRNLL